jgi:RimJ/RimL family protein N-acetyltransferase
MAEEVSPLDLLRSVLDPVRLSVLAAAARGPVSIRAIAQDLDTDPKTVAKAIGELRSLSILDKDGVLDRDVLAQVGRSLPQEHPDKGQPVDGPWTDEEALVLGRFFSRGRLLEIPTAAKKRRLVLEKIALEFEPGRRYAEREVNFRIQLIHPDYAAIRRYMVDEGLMDRADGAYWRTGGRYEVPSGAVRVPVVLPTTIEGVVLVEYSDDRAQQLADAASDERIHRYMSDRFPYPYTLEDAMEWIDFCAGEDPPNNFAIEVDGSINGGVGAVPMTGEKSGVAEIGWWLTPHSWGRGIATASAIALIDHLFEHREFMRLWAPVMAPNEASARVALRTSMVLEGTAPSAYVRYGVRHDELDFGITREQWSSRRPGSARVQE